MSIEQVFNRIAPVSLTDRVTEQIRTAFPL
jgi:hypothetical protein